jgi:diadenosine tetraphosphatase ApaH/serine/threonine PP2A family protein phosphatase
VTFAVLSDVHANREALDAVLHEVDRIGTDALLFLGDLVGYNADPEPCVEAVLGRAAAAVRGNHDKAVAGLMRLDWFNPVAAEAVRWTRRAVSATTLERLAGLPAGPLAVAGGVLLCHGTPSDEDAYLVQGSPVTEAFGYLERSHPEVRFCLHGHTHLPFAAVCRKGRIRRLPADEVCLEPSARYLLNPGSVGQPRDGNARASFGILDLSRGAWRVVRVPYDIEGARAGIAAARLPAELAERLIAGW